MKIENNILTGPATEKISFQESTKTSGKFPSNLPDTVVIHFTAGRSAKTSIQTLTDPNVKASAHLVIGRDNTITQLVPFDTIAWHAGRSSWEGRKGLNGYSIGIEIDNAGRLDKQGEEYLSWFKKGYKSTEVFQGTHRNESKPSYWHRYTEKQIEIVEQITRLLVDTYNINLILGHEEISPGRKTDPGPAFPLDDMRNGILYADRQLDDPKEFTAIADNNNEQLGIVTASKLNVRASPSASSSKVTEPLTKGSLVKITEQQGNWYKVKIEEEGWVSREWVRV
jgi:N-acetylmuramoyl-L-alanine amidase